MWKVYVASARAFWGSGRRRVGYALATGEGLAAEEALEGWESADSSAAVGPRRTIFLERRFWRGRVGFELKGGLRRPILGVIRNFWWAVGMDSRVWMAVERSVIVDEVGKEKLWGVP